MRLFVCLVSVFQQELHRRDLCQRFLYFHGPHVAPENGFVLFPCTREEGDVCHVVCAHGYLLVGPSNQTCEKENGSLVWSKEPECIGMFQCVIGKLFTALSCTLIFLVTLAVSIN